MQRQLLIHSEQDLPSSTFIHVLRRGEFQERESVNEQPPRTCFSLMWMEYNRMTGLIIIKKNQVGYSLRLELVAAPSILIPFW